MVRVLVFSFLVVAIGFASYKITHGYFSNSAGSTDNVFTASATFPTATPTPSPIPTSTPTPTPTLTPTPTPVGIATHVVISEVQIDGGPGDADHDFIELYNPTSSAVNIQNHRLVSRTGNSSSDDLIKSFTLSTIIPAHGFYLWARNSDAIFAASIGADASTSASLTSSMSIALRNGLNDTGIIIDALSWNNGATIGEGTNASVPGDNGSLERKAYTTSTQVTMEGGVDSLKGNGFDLGDNATDFILRLVSQPQNSGSAAESP